tara:strand:+ start:502 stop:699 length:198 start_codon:yes stop_codon:yes gene_type:complete
MNKLGAFLEKFVIDYGVKYVKNNKEKVIKIANDKINLPILNEKQEAELMEVVYEILVEVAEGLKK